ncbi:MAG: sugar nucleotide-binding protein [Gammaproteobacteria bacterium]|nr:sugar nucleotide-binding protein [Gammaproteobacteria bacterium]
MNSALIGYTGFVGSNILEQHSFDELYNSKNFNDMSNRHFGDIVCAGVSAVKWIANKEPLEDKKKIQLLEDTLSTISADRFILISTIDVYPEVLGKDESYDCSAAPNNAYGTHRLEFEQFCMNQFPNCYIIRLPGLFGKGLKKNVIYDLLNHNCLEMINPASSFQYYDLANTWSDIKKTLANELHLVNLFTEPVTTKTIIDRYFSGETFENFASSPVEEMHYALKSRHADLWGGSNGYIYNESQVLSQLDTFIKISRRA